MTFNPSYDYRKTAENENEHTKMLRMVSEMQKLWSDFALLLAKQSMSHQKRCHLKLFTK